MSLHVKYVRELKPGDLFRWKDDLAIVQDICPVPEHFFSTGERLMYSLEVIVPGKFHGAVQVDGATVVRVPR